MEKAGAADNLHLASTGLFFLNDWFRCSRGVLADIFVAPSLLLDLLCHLPELLRTVFEGLGPFPFLAGLLACG